MAAPPTKEEIFGIPKVKREANAPSIQEEYQGFKEENKFSSTPSKTPSPSGQVTTSTPTRRVYGVRPKCRKCPSSR